MSKNSLDKISESKKSEIIRREEAIEKGEKKLSINRQKLKEDIKEFNSIVDVEMNKIAKERKAIESREREVDSNRTETAKLKLEFNKGILKNKEELARLVKLSSELSDEKSKLAKQKRELDNRESKIKLDREDANIKISYANDKMAELNIKIEEYFAVKEKAESSRKSAKELEVRVENERTKILTLQNKIDKDKMINAEERARLQLWNESLTSLEADLRDRRLLVEIDERNVRERQRTVEKIRKEIYENKGGKK